MATEQEKPDEQSLEPKRNRTSSPRSTTGMGTDEQKSQSGSTLEGQQGRPDPMQRQPATGRNVGQPTADQLPTTGSGQDIDPLLRQQIARALRPVLTDFHQQISETVQQKIERDRGKGAEGSRVAQQVPSPSPEHQTGRDRIDHRRPEQPAQQEQQPAQLSGQQPAHVSAPEQAEQPDDTAPLQAPAEEQPVATVETKPDQEEESGEEHNGKELFSDFAHSTGDILLQVVKEQGEQQLRLLLAATLDAIFSNKVRALVKRQVHESVQALLEEVWEAIPETDPSRETEQKVTRELDVALQEALDSIFAERVQAQLRVHGDRAVEAVLRGDMDIAGRHAQRAVEAFFDAVLGALARHRRKVLRLLIGLVVGALERAVASKVREALGAGPGKVGDHMEEQLGQAQQKAQEAAQEISGKVSGAGETMRDQIEEAKKELEERLKEGLKAGLKEGTSNTQLGRPPSVGRPSKRTGPSRRTPAGRPPPPSGRPPSGLPPSARKNRR